MREPERTFILASDVLKTLDSLIKYHDEAVAWMSAAGPAYDVARRCEGYAATSVRNARRAVEALVADSCVVRP